MNPVSGCPLTAAFAAIGGKWKLIVIYWLAESPCHFAALRRLMPGISQKVLTQQLRELVAVLVNERANLYSSTMSAYSQTLHHVYAHHSNGHVTDDEWRRTSSISQAIEKLAAQTYQKLEEWERTHVRPLGVENLLKWIADRTLELAQIESNAEARTSAKNR